MIVKRATPSGVTGPPSVSVSVQRAGGEPLVGEKPDTFTDPACLAVEQFKPCHGLGAPENGARSPEKRLHPAGATIHFSCAPGYVLKGQASIKCVPGHPSHWSDPPPICRAGKCYHSLKHALPPLLPPPQSGP